MLSKDAFTTVQWKTLMCLFDIHPPSDLNVDRSISESHCPAAVSHQLLHAMSNALQPSTRPAMVAFGKKRWKIPRTKHAPRHTQKKKCHPQSLYPMRSSEQKGAEPSVFFFGRKCVKKQSAEGQTPQKRLTSKQCGKAV